MSDLLRTLRVDGLLSGSELKAVRIRAGMSQWLLAVLTDIRPQRISEVERGRRQLRHAESERLRRVLCVELERRIAEIELLLGSEVSRTREAQR